MVFSRDVLATSCACHITVRAQVSHVLFKLTAHELSATLIRTFNKTKVTTCQVSLRNQRISVSGSMVERMIVQGSVWDSSSRLYER